MRQPEPNVSKDGVPHCAYDECALYDGKRCEALGFRPDAICEPAVVQIIRDRDEWKRRAAAHGCDIEKGDVDCG